jgi:polyphosphate glucokinase
MRILIIDIGGTNVKLGVWRKRERRKFPSGKRMTPRRFAAKVLAITKDWKYDVISIGFPGPVIRGRPAEEPENLGKGWTRFRFEKAFGKPVKVINDAAMQALGSYRGGRMLLLGLGTGLGSTLILDDVVVPLELGELSYSKTRTLWDVLGKPGLKTAGRKQWEAAVHRTVNRLASAFRTDYLVLGGGHARLLRKLPPGARRGGNHTAFSGGARIWKVGAIFATPKKHTWVIT